MNDDEFRRWDAAMGRYDMDALLGQEPEPEPGAWAHWAEPRTYTCRTHGPYRGNAFDPECPDCRTLASIPHQFRYRKPAA